MVSDRRPRLDLSGPVLYANVRPAPHRTCLLRSALARHERHLTKRARHPLPQCAETSADTHHGRHQLLLSRILERCGRPRQFAHNPLPYCLPRSAGHRLDPALRNPARARAYRKTKTLRPHRPKLKTRFRKHRHQAFTPDVPMPGGNDPACDG